MVSLKKHIRTAFIYTMGLLFLIPCHSQKNDIKLSSQRIESFNSKQGFYQNTVNDIVSDAKGYLWIATPNGLVRYDGYSFSYYYHENEQTETLLNNNVSSLLSDSSGMLWIGTRGGLCVYLTDEERFITVNKFVEKEVLIKQDAKNRIWVGNHNGFNVFKVGGNQAKKIEKIAEISLKEALGGNAIADVEFLSDSELLVATSNKVFRVEFRETSGYPVKVSELQVAPNITSVRKLIKVDNSIWIGADSGLFHTFYDNGKLLTLKHYLSKQEEDDGQATCEVLSMYLDKDKKLWVGTKNNGAYQYDINSGEFTMFRHDSKFKNVLTSNRINCFHEDDFGVLWIGTAQGGLNKFDKNQKKFYNYSHNAYDKNSISSNLITDITEDKNGRVWFSFFGNTICRTDKELNSNLGNRITFRRLEKQLGALKDHWVLSLYQDQKGYWWIGTNKGTYLYDEKTQNLRKITLKIKGDPVSLIFNRVINQIKEDQILLGGAQVYLLKNPWDRILKNQPLNINRALFDIGNDNQVNDFEQDVFGNYWFACTKGVYRIKEEKGKWKVKNYFTTQPNEEGLQLSYDHVFDVFIDSNKNAWLGTYGGGLMKITLNPQGQPNSIKAYHKKDGLRDEVIYGIIEDNQGRLWMSTDMGICCFNPQKERFNFYDVNDGILSNNFRQSAFLKTKKGDILMGGVDGLTIFNPKQIVKNHYVPKILISRLKINNKPVISGEEVNNEVVIDSSISDTRKIVVKHNNRNISLDIILQHSVTPNKNRIAYKLEGVNKDWINVNSGKTTATYTNLSPGTYEFMYRGANGDGVWTTNTRQFTIRVLAPWYFRWWSVTIWALLILLVIYGVFKYFFHLEKLNQKLKFEKLDKIRVRDMNQAKLRFFTNISHDFKTPLSLIIGPLEKIADQNKNSENQKYFSIIQNNISRLQRLIDQLISYRKAETGHLQLNYSKVVLGDFMYPLMEAFEEYSHQTFFNFYYKIDQPNKIVSLDINKTERVLLNLLSNAVKYSSANKEVSVEACIIEKNNEELLVIKVMNNGVGIPPEKIDRIFDRFYRGVDDKNDWSGTGIGLALSKSLIELMKGTISVSSNKDEKTVFKIELPITGGGEDIVENDLNEHKLDEYKKIVTDWLPSELEITQDDFVDAALPTILIIDDEEDVRSFLGEAFKDKYNVLLADDGEEGLKKIKESMPQLVISDVMMPKIDGYELCKTIKNDSNLCHIPIILLTAIGDNVKKIKGLELGADDYIVKPFSIKYLEVKVKKLIENKQQVFEYFSRNSYLPKVSSLISSEKDKAFLENINESIENNMSNSSFGVEELAADIGMSTSHFYRKLKELTGQAPNAYLRNFRLQKAAELLKANKNLTAADVMFEIGIESKSYYSSAFKKIHGISPSEFVKKIHG